MIKNQSTAPEDPSCIFCKILADKAQGSFVYRDTQIAVFMDAYPLTPGHMLIIPIHHMASIADVSPSVASLMFQKAQALGRTLMHSELGCEGYNFFLANGGVAGQDVFHAHLHVIPRYQTDGFGFALPSNYPQEATRAILDRQATMLSQILGQILGSA